MELSKVSLLSTAIPFAKTTANNPSFPRDAGAPSRPCCSTTSPGIGTAEPWNSLPFPTNPGDSKEGRSMTQDGSAPVIPLANLLALPNPWTRKSQGPFPRSSALPAFNSIRVNGIIQGMGWLSSVQPHHQLFLGIHPHFFHKNPSPITQIPHK